MGGLPVTPQPVPHRRPVGVGRQVVNPREGGFHLLEADLRGRSLADVPLEQARESLLRLLRVSCSTGRSIR
jgi:hypothetical protein